MTRQYNENTKAVPQWLEVPVVNEQFQRAAKYVAEGVHADFQYYVRCGIMARVDSPLEAIFSIWATALQHLNWTIPVHLSVQHEIELPQANYRLDFVVTPNEERFILDLEQVGMTWPKIGVEVDGHAFHEKTVEQVELRNRRDRDLQLAGWKIFHFSWSEVTRDPMKCVSEVMLYGRDIYNTLSGDLWNKQVDAGLIQPVRNE